MLRSQQLKRILDKMGLTTQDFEKARNESKLFCQIIDKLIESELNLNPSTREDYNAQHWAFSRADRDGYNRALMKIRNLVKE